MNYPQEFFIELFGVGFGDIFRSAPSQEFVNRCSELSESVKMFRTFLERIETIRNRIEYIKPFIGIKEDFPQILNQLLSRSGWTMEFALGAGFEHLMEALKVLGTDLEALKTKFVEEVAKLKEVAKLEEEAKEKNAYERAEFDMADLGDLLTLKKYTKISESLKKTKDVKELEKIMRDYNQQSASAQRKYRPFVFVCASSGTGKTNMALSFDLRSILLTFTL